MKQHSLASLFTSMALVFVLTQLPVLAQTAALELSTWDTQVWPEYDQPSVLVITSGSFVAGTTFPQQARVPIPASAVVHAVAYPDANGNLLSLSWAIEPGVDGQTVVFDLDQPSFVVEYYADIITPPPSRSFDLDLVAPYSALQASLTLRQPSRASDLQTTPAMAPGGVDALGNPTYTLDLGPLAAGASTPVQVSYTKADVQPSATSAAAPVVAERSSAAPWWPWVAGVAAAVLAGGVTFYLVQRSRSTTASRQSRRRSARKQGAQPARQPSGGAAPAAAAARFCVQCGRKFEGSDKFCRNCGAPRS